MQKLNLGVLSVSGHVAKRLVVPFKNANNYTLKAVASRSIEKAQAFAKQLNFDKAYGSYEELVKDHEVDFIFIPLPNHLHAQWVKKAADHGKHILCEKPFALNAAETIEAINYAENKNVKVMEAFMYRFQPQWLKAKELIDLGEIGTVKNINTFFSYNNPDPKNIRNSIECGGGALMDIGCYATSVPRFLLGKEPNKVFAMVERDAQLKVDTDVSAIMDFEGVTSSFTVSTRTDPYQQVVVHGTNGSITINQPFNTYVDVPATLTVKMGLGTRNIQFDVYDQYGIMFEAFATTILEDKPVPTSPLDAINNMKVIDAVFESANSGNWVTIKSMTLAKNERSEV